jgi:predicted enzyme related to lactoylglutathione lyase
MLGTLRQLIVPVVDMDAAINHYRDELGLPLKFRDGSRWAALEAGDLTLGLAGPGEQPGDGSEPALGVKVTDLDAALERMLSCGGAMVTAKQTGAHEARAVCRDRFGTLVALYQPMSS